MKIKILKAFALAVAPLCASFLLQNSVSANPDVEGWIPPSIEQCAKSKDPKLQKICLDILAQMKKTQLEQELDRGCLYEEESNQFLGFPISEECKERLRIWRQKISGTLKPN